MQYIPANDALEEPRLILIFPAGINQNQTPDIGEASDGYNFELGARQSKLIPRASFDLKGVTPNGSAITGFGQLIKRSTGVQTTLVVAGTAVYKVSNLAGVQYSFTFATAPASGATISAIDANGYQYSAGTGDGVTTTFTITSSSPITPPILLYKADWQGSQLQYATSRTNYVLQSQTLPTAWSQINLTVGANIGTAPDGTVTADSLTHNVVTSSSWAGQTITLADNTNIVISCFFKANGWNYAGISFATKDNSTPRMTVNLITGQVVGTYGVHAPTIYGVISYPNGWYRIWFANNTFSGAQPLAIFLHPVQTASDPFGPFTGDGVNGVLAWGAQIELGTTLTSYIPTTTTTVTTTDYALIPSSNFSLVGSVVNGAKLRDLYWSLGDYLIFVDENPVTNNVVTMWDGATFQTMPTGLGSSFSAQYSVVFNNRVWFFNIMSGTTDLPHMIVVSAFENPQSLNTAARGGPTNLGGTTFATGLEAFYLFTPDLKAINGVSVFQNVLVISTIDGQLFKLTGTNAADYQFVNFYVGSAAIGYSSMVNIGNDVMYMRKGGNINLVRSVQAFGDVKSNDVARWIPNLTKNVSTAMGIYDQTAQKIYFFIPNMVLVLFKDILYGAETDSAINQGLSPWSVYKTSHPNGFNTSAAKYMQIPGTTNYTVFWGDSSGNIYDMNGTGLSDGGIYPVQLSRTSRIIDASIMRPFPWNEEVLLGKVQYRRQSTQSTLNISFQWTDEYNTSTCSVPLKGAALGNVGPVYNGGSYYNASSYYSQGFQFANVLSHQNFSPTGKGPGFYITLGNQGASQWQIDQLELY